MLQGSVVAWSLSLGRELLRPTQTVAFSALLPSPSCFMKVLGISTFIIARTPERSPSLSLSNRIRARSGQHSNSRLCASSHPPVEAPSPTTPGAHLAVSTCPGAFPKI